MTERPESTSASVRIGASVLTWRGQDATLRCLRSLMGSAAWPMPTLVVDNASGTGEGEALAAEFEPPVEALTMPSNGGVGSGYNAAIRWARSRDLDFVLLLNNDTVIEDDRLVHRLLAAARDDVAAIGPVVIDRDGSIWSAGGSVVWWSGDARRHHRPPPMPRDADWLDGSCLLVSVEAACSVGGFAEDYFLYWEEVDWCTRARRAGLRCVVEPRASIRHERSASTTNRQLRVYSLRNALLFMRRNGSWPANVTSLVAFLLVRTPVFLARRLRAGATIREALSDAAGAIGWNVRDALRRRSWRRPADGPTVCPGDEA